MRRVTLHDIPTDDPTQGASAPLRRIFARNADGGVYVDPDDENTLKQAWAWFGLTGQPLPKSLRENR